MGRAALRKASLLSLVAFAGVLSGGDLLAQETSRLSAAVVLIYGSPAASAWLESLAGASYIDAYVMFPPQTGDDVIFGIDQEFDDGVAHPAYIKGGDWMGLVGLQRTGSVWVAKGTADTMNGKPSKVRTWEIIPLKQPLKPDVWYRIRTVIDFHTRRYVSFTIAGPNLNRTLDLKAFTVDYPNYLPFDRRMLTSYVYAMRGKGLVKDPHSAAVAYFDDVGAGLIAPDGKDTPLFHDDFEAAEEKLFPLDIPLTAFLGATIAVDKYKEGFWYLERKKARARVVSLPRAKSGSKVLLCDATLNTVDYADWFSRSPF